MIYCVCVFFTFLRNHFSGKTIWMLRPRLLASNSSLDTTWTVSRFINSFVLWASEFRILNETVAAGLSKLHSKRLGEHFRTKEKNMFFQTLSNKNFRLWAKLFRSGCQICIWRAWGNICKNFGKSFLFLDCEWKCFSLWLKTFRQVCQRETLWGLKNEKMLIPN